MRNKRKLSLRQRKYWTEKETAALVDYILENRNIEKPRAKIYYRKFLEQSKVDAPWELLRWKVRNLRLSFDKAKKIQQLILAGNLQESCKDKYKKIWPHFHKLKLIFDDDNEESHGNLEESSTYSTVYTITSFDNLNEPQIPKIEPNESAIFDQLPPLVPIRDCEPAHSVVLPNDLSALSCAAVEPDQPQSLVNLSNDFRETSSQQSTDSTKVTSSANKRKKSLQKNFITAFTRSQEVRNAHQRQRLKFEKEKFYKEFEFQKEKFKIEQELRREELALKKSQIEREERVKVLEMEYNERIAKYELDLKYDAKVKV